MGKENRWTQFSSKATRALRGIKGGDGEKDKPTHRHTKSEPIRTESLPWGGLGPNSEANVPVVDVVPSDVSDGIDMVQNTKEKDRQAQEIVDTYLKDSRRSVSLVDIDTQASVMPTPQKKNVKRLDKYGFIVNIDDKGLLRDESSVEMPGGAYTPSATSNANTKTPKTKTIPKRFKLGGNSEKKSKDQSKNGGKSGKSKKEERQMKRLRRRREKKWLTMLAQWDDQTLASSKQRRNKLRQRVRKGIPNSCRGQGWVRIAKIKEKIEVTHVGVYAQLVAESSGPETDVNDSALNPNPNTDVNVDRNVMKETIERDLTRTFPRHSMFYDSFSDESSDEEDDASFDKISASGSLDSITSRSIGEEGGVTCTFSNEDDGEEEVEMQITDPKSSSKDVDTTDMSGDRQEAGINVSYEADDAARLNDDTCWGKSIQNLSSHCPVPPNFVGKKESALEVITSTPPRPPIASPGSPKGKSSHRKKEKIVDYSQAEGGQASLRRVLRAYSIYDPDVGYCQGMNFIAGMFITFVTEEEAFWLLVHVMSEAPCRMRGLFGEGMSEAHQVLYVAERLIAQFHPRLARHFDRENVHITMFATQWLLTMYTSSFPFEIVTRIWDAYLSEGWKVTYRVMLALLEKAQPLLMKMQFEDILNYFKELPFEIESNEIMENAFKIPLKKKHIGKYAKEWIHKQKEKENDQQQLG